jgi:hypothetical protein
MRRAVNKKPACRGFFGLDTARMLKAKVEVEPVF